MDASFIPQDVVPGKTAFGLDQLRRSYKTSLSAQDAVAAAPAKGAVDEEFAFMFLTRVDTPESSTTATRVELTYQGCLAEDEGDPLLPEIQHSSSTQVSSATTASSSIIWPACASQPATLQFFCGTTTIVIVATSDAPSDEPDDPPAVVASDIITYNLGACDAAGGTQSAIITWLLTNAYVQYVSETTDTQEIVPGQYWRVTKRKVRTLLPYAPA
jgi:hypothetical protein